MLLYTVIHCSVTVHSPTSSTVPTAVPSYIAEIYVVSFLQTSRNYGSKKQRKNQQSYKLIISALIVIIIINVIILIMIYYSECTRIEILTINSQVSL